MPLDFCIKNNHDEIIILVPIDPDSFYSIIEKSKFKSGFSIINIKLIDYFGDAEFFMNEVPKLKIELEIIRQDFIGIEKTSEVIYLLIQLCDMAIHLRKTISLLAD